MSYGKKALSLAMAAVVFNPVFLISAQAKVSHKVTYAGKVSLNRIGETLCGETKPYDMDSGTVRCWGKYPDNKNFSRVVAYKKEIFNVEYDCEHVDHKNSKKIVHVKGTGRVKFYAEGSGKATVTQTTNGWVLSDINEKAGITTEPWPNYSGKCTFKNKPAKPE